MSEFSGYKRKKPVFHRKIDFWTVSLKSKTLILQIVTDFWSTRKERIFENFPAIATFQIVNIYKDSKFPNPLADLDFSV